MPHTRHISSVLARNFKEGPVVQDIRRIVNMCHRRCDGGVTGHVRENTVLTGHDNRPRQSSDGARPSPQLQVIAFTSRKPIWTVHTIVSRFDTISTMKLRGCSVELHRRSGANGRHSSGLPKELICPALRLSEAASGRSNAALKNCQTKLSRITTSSNAEQLREK
ncbi:hypothetical protein Pmar_PMAR013746 [Perkinsus marinus ATCC 50983]|uniref:Uncharacterized protein n=1 Tax=Perkinsus marinus (strain ATCC 50983 / TXsc) TaxID=423536 RepID=C5LY67_PERM5|nr:hypothetical protein Pmar_PMAR013746 [Perkinsus marinus ATCC 50983]EEQ98397.1 hypothetical protein Pmar_PMAR013746 [Perkinsus marinus ATCC 50983]|eukprot:XP_002765680.1 hypothetical protein Pmar_PMAR013746 [Perkinsus marinus ATCC 50983]